MKSTFDLYTRALSTQTKAELARRIDVHVTTWTNVERERHMPPTVAGKVAIEMGEDPRDWITLAHIEAIEKKHPDTARKLRRACRYSLFCPKGRKHRSHRPSRLVDQVITHRMH